MPKKTTLILGAGASASYGFPIGSELREQILQLAGNVQRASELLGIGQQSLKDFVKVFRTAQTYSIDAFLGRRAEYAQAGKAAIAHLIIAAEHSSTLLESSDHWYQYLVNRMAHDQWDRFDPSWLSVVTFNYDRSLQVYLCNALKSMYGKSDAEVLQKLRRMQVVHMYGSLGSPWPEDEDYLQYRLDPEDLYEGITNASRRIRVVPEGRTTDETIQQARKLILMAEQVCVLGFGFDETNVERLGGKDTFVDVNGGTKSQVCATAIGLTRAEKVRAAGQLWGRPDAATGLVGYFHDMRCLALLKETLAIG